MGDQAAGVDHGGAMEARREGLTSIEGEEFARALAIPASLSEAEAASASRGQLTRRLEFGELAHAAMLIERLFEANPHVKEVLFTVEHGGGLSAEAMVEVAGLGEVVSNMEHSVMLRMAPRVASNPTEEQKAKWAAGIASNEKTEAALARAVVRLRACSPLVAKLAERPRGPIHVRPSSASDIAAALGFPEVGAAIEAARVGGATGAAPKGPKRSGL